MPKKERKWGVRVEKESYNLDGKGYDYRIYASPKYHFSSDKIERVFQKKLEEEEKLGEATLLIHKEDKKKIADIDFFYPTRDFAQKHGELKKNYPLQEQELSHAGIPEKVLIHMINDAISEKADVLIATSDKKAFSAFMEKHNINLRRSYLPKGIKKFFVTKGQFVTVKKRLLDYLKQIGVTEK